MGIFGFGECKSKSKIVQQKSNETMNIDSLSYEEQLRVFESLGYKFTDGVTKELILRDVYEMTWDEETGKHIENNPFSVLYYFYGWRDPKVPNYNYTENCIWFDLEFFDPNSQYKWFMERMGAITNGEIEFKNIEISIDSDNYEWISFEVNGIKKKWKLEKTGYIADSYVQRFSYLTSELKTKGRFTYFDNGGQQWVIDYATDNEQEHFNKVTGLKREWLREGNHFSEPKE